MSVNAEEFAQFIKIVEAFPNNGEQYEYLI